jgi:hypothetical protein
MMIWTAGRNMDQGALVAAMYGRADAIPCERKAVMAGGLPGADTTGVLTQAGIDASRHLTIGIEARAAATAGGSSRPVPSGRWPMTRPVARCRTSFPACLSLLILAGTWLSRARSPR